MVVIRDVFRLKFGKAKDALKNVKEAIELNKKFGINKVRVMTDLTGPSYTLVFETEHDSLADFESKLKKIFSTREWKKSYQKLIPLVESSYREVFTRVD